MFAQRKSIFVEGPKVTALRIAIVHIDLHVRARSSPGTIVIQTHSGCAIWTNGPTVLGNVSVRLVKRPVGGRGKVESNRRTARHTCCIDILAGLQTL